MRLLLTLGHNSSAILVDDEGKVLIGYEEERLSHIKADSAFPKLAISKILEYYSTGVKEIYISHWFWHWSLTNDKYYDGNFIKVNFPDAYVHSLHSEFTHHDAHAHSVWNFCDGDTSGLTIVADGFGNMGECLSLYSNGKLQHRSYEVSWSLGLMYQYATAYLGMKEHQDEYKLLGYEQQRGVDKNKLNVLIGLVYQQQIEALLRAGSIPKSNMERELMKAREHWYTIFELADGGRRHKPTIAKLVQQLVEKVIRSIAEGASSIKCSGGVFYNVKLNNMLVNLPTVEKLEVTPLCGDQGCGIGMVDDIRYNHVFWGKRKVLIEEGTSHMTGYMEFGPRALGNTSTIAMATIENVELINKANGRPTIMPMAPIVSEIFAKTNFYNIWKVNKSLHFMIIAFDYKNMCNEWRGAAHIDKDRNIYTGRPQVMDPYTQISVVNEVVENGGIMINTSLNAHGQPIIYNQADYEKMREIQQRNI